MAQTSWGFDGTINESQWAQMAGLLGNGYVAADSNSCVTTAVGGARSVSVSAGTLFGDGVVTVLSTAETVAMTTPVNGQWYVIALRRTWATNTTALVAIAGATTSTTTPTAPPSSYPTLNTNVGVLTDQPIAWAWCNSANTTVVVFDTRLFPMRTQPTPVASSVARDAKFPSPTQGTQVWRDDLGMVETYYGLYNSSTNPGGREVTGWYTDTRQNAILSIRPTTTTIVSGSGSTNSMGTVTFTNATKVQLDGIFSTKYKNYKIEFQSTSTASVSGDLRFITNGTEITTATYAFACVEATGSTVNASSGSVQSNARFTFFPGSTTPNTCQMEVYRPNETANTHVITTTARNGGGASYIQIIQTNFYGNDSFTGISFIPVSGTISGTVTVYGITN